MSKIIFWAFFTVACLAATAIGLISTGKALAADDLKRSNQAASMSGGRVVLIENLNGYTFTHMVLTDGTHCVEIESQLGSLAGFRTVQCDFNNRSFKSTYR